MAGEIQPGMLVPDCAQDEVEALEETRVWLGALDDVLLAPDRDACSSATLRREQAQSTDGQIGSITFVEDAQELATDLAFSRRHSAFAAHRRNPF